MVAEVRTRTQPLALAPAATSDHYSDMMSSHIPTPTLTPTDPYHLAAHWLRLAAAATGYPAATLPAALAADPATWRRRLTPLGLAAGPYVLADALHLGRKARAAWQPAYATVAQAATLHAERTAMLAERLAQITGWCVPLKGAVSRALYPDPALRPSHDIDLWVPAAALPILTSVLASLGYTPLTPSLPRFNFEWTFVPRDGGPAVDIHIALAPTWRIPWQPQPPNTASVAAELHAAHALAHFAQHKGSVKPVQELDLVLWSERRLPQVVPPPLHPAATLWRLRYAAFWGSQYHHATGERALVLRALYRARAWPASPQPGSARERALGLALASRPRGWLLQALGCGGLHLQNEM